MKNLIILALICLSTNVHSRSTIVRGQIIDSISGDFDSMLKTKVLGKESTVIFYYEDRTNDIYALYTKDCAIRSKRGQNIWHEKQGRTLVNRDQLKEIVRVGSLLNIDQMAVNEYYEIAECENIRVR